MSPEDLRWLRDGVPADFVAFELAALDAGVPEDATREGDLDPAATPVPGMVVDRLPDVATVRFTAPESPALRVLVFFAGLFLVTGCRPAAPVEPPAGLPTGLSAELPGDLPADFATAPVVLPGAFDDGFVPFPATIDLGALEGFRDTLGPARPGVIPVTVDDFFAAVFADVFGAGLAAAVLPAAGLVAAVLPTAAVLPVAVFPAVFFAAVFLTAVFLLADLPAPVALLADLRGLVVAMRVSRRMSAALPRHTFDSTVAIHAR